MFKVLHQLSEQELRSLAAALRDGLHIDTGRGNHSLHQICGARTPGVEACLRAISYQGFTNHHAATLIDAVVDGKQVYQDPASLIDLVLSGPDVPGIQPRDTSAVLHDLVTQAKREVLVAGYAVYQGNQVFEYLAARMEQIPSLRVTLCLDIRRDYEDSRPADGILKRFATDFRTYHWPWDKLPKLYYDPRSLATDKNRRSSLHAKCVVVDRTRSFVTSANFTEAAQKRNIETGVLVSHPPVAERLSLYFETLIASNKLLECTLTCGNESAGT